MELVICAAVRWGEKIWMGHRHGHATQAMHDELSWDKSRKELALIDPEQGFVTSTGRFVDRKEAYQIFIASGKVSKSRDGFRGESLYSEDLY